MPGNMRGTFAEQPLVTFEMQMFIHESHRATVNKSGEYFI